MNFSSALTKVPPGTSLIGNTNITIYILILLSNLTCARCFFEITMSVCPKCYQLNALLFLKEENLRKEFHQYFFHTRIYALHPKFAFFAASKTFSIGAQSPHSFSRCEYTTSPPRLNTIKPPIINPSPFKLFLGVLSPIFLKFFTTLYILIGFMRVQNKLDFLKAPPWTARKNANVSSRYNCSSLFQKSLANSTTSSSMDSFSTQCNSQFASFSFFSIDRRRRISARQNTHPGRLKTHTTADVFVHKSFPRRRDCALGSSTSGASDKCDTTRCCCASPSVLEESSAMRACMRVRACV